MKLEVKMIERKEQLTELHPFHVENALWGTEQFPKMHGYIGFIPGDGFYLKLVCEETNPLRTYTKANDPVYQDSAMEVFLMFDSEGEKAHKGVYINLEMNSNGALLAGYGSGHAYRSFFTNAEHAMFECKAEIHEKNWTVELKVPVVLLERIYGPLHLGEKSEFTCNFYKISETKSCEHYVSYAPIESDIPNFHVPEFFAEAEIVR